jgi:hypothetical protein
VVLTDWSSADIPIGRKHIKANGSSIHRCKKDMVMFEMGLEKIEYLKREEGIKIKWN